MSLGAAGSIAGKPFRPTRGFFGAPGGLSFAMAIVGGTGAFMGARGQMAARLNSVIAARPVPTRSATEDPSQRRTLPSGTSATRLYLIPAVIPAIQSAMHSDFTPVTSINPAKPGEVLIRRATGLGPTAPPTDYGAVFPSEPLAIVNSPVEVQIAGREVAPVNKVGWPGTTDTYRVDFRVPDDLAEGAVSMRVVAAFIPSTEFVLPVRR